MIDARTLSSEEMKTLARKIMLDGGMEKVRLSEDVEFFVDRYRREVVIKSGGRVLLRRSKKMLAAQATYRGITL